MEITIPQLRIADYRKFLLSCDRCNIRKIKVTGPDVASILPILCKEMARIKLPDKAILSVCVPDAACVAFDDMASLQRSVTGDNKLPVVWDAKEVPEQTNVSVAVYFRLNNRSILFELIKKIMDDGPNWPVDEEI